MLLTMLISGFVFSQTIFNEDFGTSQSPTSSNDYGRKTSPYMPSGSFTYGTSKANSSTYAINNIDNDHYAVVAPEFIYSGVATGYYYFWTLPSPGATGITGAPKPYTEDHTTGDTNGAVMVVNAGTTVNSFYERNVNLEKGSCYRLSFWVYLVNASSQVGVEIKDVSSNAVLQSYSTAFLSTEATWTQYTIDFKMPTTCTSSDIKIALKSIYYNNSGNDYFIDDIKLEKLSTCTATAISSCPTGKDTDGDGIPDNIDLDDDNDGITDCDENLLGANASVSNVFSFVTAGTTIATSNNEVRLTQDTGYQAGQIWSVGKVDFTKSFVLRFDAYLGTHDDGADGIAAVFHNSPQGVNATGATGLGIGASGIANGIVLELDTYDNGTSLGDISSDHGQIWDSDNQTSTGFLTTAVALPNLENNTWHPIVINWNATTKTISYTVDGTNAGTYTGDLVTNYFAGASKVYFGYTASTGGSTNEQRIRINSFCSDLPLEMDSDNDGTPNQLDTDSDGDGCADAIEGSENVTYSQIHALDLPVSDTNYAYRGQIKVKYDGVTTGSPSQIISTSAAANGVPQLLNNAGNNLNASTNPSNLAGAVDNTDGTADIGQGIGDSQDNTINSCKCYKAPSTDGNNYPTQHGITAFNRAGTDNQNWPMVRQSGWTALEASTKGFVINRMPVSTSGGNIGEPVDGSNNAVITSPIAGMMFYDTTNDCLKINVDGTRSGWKCFNKQTCPDEN